jgi:hypothetical protein
MFIDSIVSRKGWEREEERKSNLKCFHSDQLKVVKFNCARLFVDLFLASVLIGFFLQVKPIRNWTAIQKERVTTWKKTVPGPTVYISANLELFFLFTWFINSFIFAHSPVFWWRKMTMSWWQSMISEREKGGNQVEWQSYYATQSRKCRRSIKCRLSLSHAYTFVWWITRNYYSHDVVDSLLQSAGQITYCPSFEFSFLFILHQSLVSNLSLQLKRTEKKRDENYGMWQVLKIHCWEVNFISQNLFQNFFYEML